MSDYQTKKQVVYPVDKHDPDLMNKWLPNYSGYGKPDIFNLDMVPELKDLFMTYPKKQGFEAEVFDDGSKVNYYLAYTLDQHFDGYNEYGKSRELSDSEKVKYKELFEKIIPNVDPDKFKLVEYCWYDCCEAPDYYNWTKEKDPFYEEV